jgi:hypothetical protein
MDASLYRLEWCVLSFCRMVNTPVGVAWPGRPVAQVETPIRMPSR